MCIIAFKFNKFYKLQFLNLSERKKERMKTDKLYYLREVTLDSIGNSILDNNIAEGDKILINYRDFENIILNYRDRYGVSMTFPYSLLGVLIEEEKSGDLPTGRIKVIKEGEKDISIERRNTLSSYLREQINKYHGR